MRRISRIDRSIALLWARTIAPTPSPHLCSACMHQGASYSTSLIRPAPANTKAPFTEKIRQRIWGTDQPPGQEDPYGDASVFDRTKRGLEKTEVEEPETPEALETAEATATEVSADYEPAHTWDGLEEVGGFSEYWDSDNQFRGFLPAEITTDTAEVTAALHRAMVEVFALQRAGKQLVEVSSTVPGEDLTYEVKLSPSATGATLQFSDNSSLAQVVQSLAPAVDETKEKGAPTQSEEDVVADRSTEDPQAGNTSDLAYADIVASWDPSWLQISLENPEVKFAVLKRTMQLTGVRIPDSAIKSANTAQALLNYITTPPKPSKLIDALTQKQDLMNLPNVTIFSRRVTAIDKERTVGRWKIIEEELKKRGLPMKGHGELEHLIPESGL